MSLSKTECFLPGLQTYTRDLTWGNLLHHGGNLHFSGLPLSGQPSCVVQVFSLSQCKDRYSLIVGTSDQVLPFYFKARKDIWPVG